MKKVILLGCFVLALFSFTFSQYVLMTTGEYAPWTSESMKGKGIASEIITEAFNRMEGYEPVYEFYPWKRAESMVQSGNAWGAFPYAVSEERLEKYVFSVPIVVAKNVFFYLDKGETIEYETLEDLKKFKIGGVLGYFYEPWFEEAGLDVSYAKEELASFKKLIAGRVDLIPMTEVIAWTIINKEFPGMKDQFRIVEKPLQIAESGIMISKDYPDSNKILEAFNKALNSMKDDGSYQMYLDKIKE